MSDEEIEAPLPRGGYAIDWDAIDLNGMDPFATKAGTGISNSFGTSNPIPAQDPPKNPKTTENVKSPGSASPDENKNPESNIPKIEENTTKQPEKKKVTKSPTKKKATEKRVPMKERIAAMKAKKAAEQSQTTTETVDELVKEAPAKKVGLNERIQALRAKKASAKTEENGQESDVQSNGTSTATTQRKISRETAPSEATLPESVTEKSSYKKPSPIDWDTVDLDSVDPFATSKPKQPAPIDWENCDINNLDPFGTKSKISNNASSSSNPTQHIMSDVANPCTPPRNNILEQTCFETPGLRESDLSNQLKDLSIVNDDDSQLLKDVESTAQIATPLKSFNPLKITASEELTYTPDVKNHTNQSKMDSTSKNSSSLLQNSGRLNSIHQHSNLAQNSSIGNLNSDDINAELLNLLVRCVTNQQVDNEIYKHLRERERAQREVSMQEANDRADIEDYTDRLKKRYEKLKNTHNDTDRKRKYTILENEISSQRDRNYKANDSLEDMRKTFLMEKLEWARKLKEAKEKNSLLESQRRMDKIKINTFETELSHSKQQVAALSEQNQGLEAICEDLLNDGESNGRL